MAKKSKQQPPTPIKPDVASAGPPPVPALTPEQQVKAQQLQTAHAVLKVKFADVSVALDIAVRERDQILARLQQAQGIIEHLTNELRAEREGPSEEDIATARAKAEAEAEAETPSKE